MTTRRRYQPRRRSSGGRRKVTWTNTALTLIFGTSGGLVFAELTPPPLDFAEDFHGTAVLQRSIISFSAVQITPVGNNTQQYALAMYVGLRTNILALNILAPLANLGQDWYYWTARSTFEETVTARARDDWEIDLRSKRSLRAGYGLVMVGEPLLANVSDIHITAGIRQLWAIVN